MGNFAYTEITWNCPIANEIPTKDEGKMNHYQVRIWQKTSGRTWLKYNPDVYRCACNVYDKSLTCSIWRALYYVSQHSTHISRVQQVHPFCSVKRWFGIHMSTLCRILHCLQTCDIGGVVDFVSLLYCASLLKCYRSHANTALNQSTLRRFLMGETNWEGI